MHDPLASSPRNAASAVTPRRARARVSRAMAPPGGDGSGPGRGGAAQKPVVTSTLLFRMMNPELYVGYNRWIAGVGSLVCGLAVVNVGLMKYERERELKREREENERIP